MHTSAVELRGTRVTRTWPPHKKHVAAGADTPMDGHTNPNRSYESKASHPPYSRCLLHKAVRVMANSVHASSKDFST